MIRYCDTCTLTRYVRYLSPSMIAKWDSGFPAACDNTCIIYGIYQLSFYASINRSTSLNDIGRTSSISLPMTVVVLVLDGVMLLV